jgi:hypothetical protein
MHRQGHPQHAQSVRSNESMHQQSLKALTCNYGIESYCSVELMSMRRQDPMSLGTGDGYLALLVVPAVWGPRHPSREDACSRSCNNTRMFVIWNIKVIHLILWYPNCKLVDKRETRKKFTSNSASVVHSHLRAASLTKINKCLACNLIMLR